MIKRCPWKFFASTKYFQRTAILPLSAQPNWKRKFPKTIFCIRVKTRSVYYNQIFHLNESFSIKVFPSVLINSRKLLQIFDEVENLSVPTGCEFNKLLNKALWIFILFTSLLPKMVQKIYNENFSCELVLSMLNTN